MINKVQKRHLKLISICFLVFALVFTMYNTVYAEDTPAPDTISVQTLEDELDNSNETTTDKVKYIDVNGNSIANAPTSIELGNIEDHKELNVGESDGKHYEFISAQVKGKDVVFIGKYEGTVYYSTDGNIGIKLEDGQNLEMKYQEFYQVTIKENIPENGVAGAITSDGETVDISKPIRVNAGEDYKINIQPAVANKIRYKISNVDAEKSTSTITKSFGNEYNADYTMNFQSDDTVTITYNSEGVYSVHVKETNNNGETCITTDETHYSGGYINNFTYTESDVTTYNELWLPVFHTCSNKRIISLQVNGISVLDATTHAEVPAHNNTSLSPRVTTPKGNTFIIEISVKEVKSLLGAEKNCDYEYKITVKKDKGNWEDLNFKPSYGERKVQSLTLKGLTEINGRAVHSDEGLEMAMWDYSDGKSDQLVPVKDYDVFSMDPTKGITRRQVKFFFAKAKPGYYISSQGGLHPSGGQNTEDTYEADGPINELNSNTLSGANLTNLKENWENAKNAAQAAGYTHFVVITGEMGDDGENLLGFDWDLYTAQFYARQNKYYTMYDEGKLPDGTVVSNMPESNIKTRGNKTKSNPYTNKPVFGSRALGDTFNVGEKFSEPYCEGYKFVGWKLVDANEKEEKIYQNNDVFTIDSSNVSYANTPFVNTKSYSYTNAYRFVAQWEKIGTRNVIVKHHLEVPDGTDKIAKTTEGSIKFAEDNETVTAIGIPEKDGTFPEYIFDKDNKKNELEKTVTNDNSTDTIELNIYYKPTVLTVSKKVEGYVLESNKSFEFTIKATSTGNGQSLDSKDIYLTKDDSVNKLTFTNNQAKFELKAGESIDLSCLPKQWTYSVTETYPGSNFRVLYSMNDETTKKEGKTASFTMDSTGKQKVEFTNTSTIAPPETGITSQSKDYLPLFAIGLGTCILMLLFINKKYRKIKK